MYLFIYIYKFELVDQWNIETKGHVSELKIGENDVVLNVEKPRMACVSDISVSMTHTLSKSTYIFCSAHPPMPLKAMYIIFFIICVIG